MQEIIENNRAIWVDPQLLGTDRARDAFDAGFWQAQSAIIGSAQGRGTTWFVRGAQCDMALRHYRRGGLFGKIVSDSYWFTGWEQTRSYQEMHILQRLVDGGVNVPRPVAAQAVRSGLTYQADILVEKINDSEDLVGLLQRQPIEAERWNQIGQMIRRMHDLQVCHTDLNAHNILLDAQQQVWLIDFDKCYQQQGESWKAKNLARLKRSFSKEVGRCNIHWQEADWQLLCQGYDTAAV
ncbi:3-deoxy-D-manno-octulosonic acid kinase [Photobacterium japonica]|uniref:3-deoxy-D-manno-octulosonic acid kinase n=1 Tax=Photobacterium japonica TaxID=2910235 RepID=UPI003D0D27AC